MPVKKEICRNFARGSCHFGQRCRFLHVSPQSQQQQQQQNRPSFNNANNIFSQQHQQQKPNNPYGFGVQNNSQQPKGFTQTQPKPFENSWSRFASNTPAPTPAPSSSSSSRQSEIHKCTDAELCRRIVVDDFQNERPIWKLTCYGHWKGIPCDIVGDISYEELRAAAYDDAKRGLALHSIVEKELNLLNSKLVEFENLCKPRAVVLPNLNLPASEIALNLFSQVPAAAPVSSFGQHGTSHNLGFGSTSTVSQNNAFGFGQPNAFGQPNPFGDFSRMKTESQVQKSIGYTSTPSNPISTPATGAFGVFNSNSTTVPSIREVVVQPNQGELTGVDAAWFKEKWNPGEVPEEAPPDAICS